jgi:hypothetical protein
MLSVFRKRNWFCDFELKLCHPAVWTWELLGASAEYLAYVHRADVPSVVFVVEILAADGQQTFRDLGSARCLVSQKERLEWWNGFLVFRACAE